MRTILKSLFAVTVVVLLASCPTPFDGDSRSSAGDDAGAVAFALPSDQVSDIGRSVAGPFTFETLHPVSVDLAVDLYAVDDAGALQSDPLPPDAASVLVSLETEAGSPVYAGRLRADGTLSATVYLPAAPADMVLELSAAGFESRTVSIAEMVRYSRIERRMSMRQLTTASGAARSVSGLVDSDGDGVPDVYDAFPNDPDAAFVQNVPADGNLTIAFEDLFGRANAGDADYNDFIASYRIQEISNADGYVTSIRVDATAVVKLAGYNHRFGIRIDRFDGDATLEREYVDFGGATRTETVYDLSGPLEVELFENSATAVGKQAWFTLSFDTPQRQSDSPSPLSAPPYNPWAIVRNTGHDIHLIDREPLTELITSKNPDDRFVDGTPGGGFPWALLVPDDWTHPAEAERIDSDEWYPRFTNWRLSGGEDFTDWYHYLGDPWVEPEEEPAATVVSDINPDSASSRPNWLTSTATGLYFAASDDAYGNELWRLADGSVSRLTDLVTGSASSSPRFLTEHGGDMFFVASNGGDEPGLFRYASGGVTQIATIERPGHLLSTADGLYASGFTPDSGSELWLYDGSVAAQVAEINPGADGSSPRYLVSFDNQVYFQADDGTNGQELWRFDGTTASLAADVNPTGSSTPTNLIVYDGDLYFRATDGVNGYELWRYDGASATRVTDINPAGDSLTVAEMAVHNGRLYFAAYEGSSGFELYEYDGVDVRQVIDLLPGAGSGVSLPFYLVSHGDVLYFSGNDGSVGSELYQYDGSSVSLAADINPSGSGQPQSLEVHDNALYFRADDGQLGSELWVYR